MELRAIIGRKNKKKIESSQIEIITNYLQDTLTNGHDVLAKGYLTNAHKLPEDRPSKDKEGKNLYLHVLNLNDDIKLYPCLANNGLKIRDTKFKSKK